MDNNGKGNNTSLHDDPLMSEHSCFYFPGWVSNVPQMPFMYLQVQMLVIFVINQLFHRLFFQRIGMPPLVSELFTGLVLSYTGIGKYKAFRDVLFPDKNFNMIKCIILFSYTLFLFINATQVDFTIITRTGKKTMMIALLSLGSSVAANVVCVQFFKSGQGTLGDLRAALAILPIAAFANIIRLVSDIGLLNSELGRLALSCGLFVEVGSILLTMVVNTIIPAFDSWSMARIAMIDVSGATAILLAVIFILRPLMKFLVRMTPKDRPIKDTYVLFAFLSMLGIALCTTVFGQFVFLGPVIVGFAIPNGPPLGSALMDMLDSLFNRLLFPFIVSASAVRIDVFSINFNGTLAYHLLILMAVTTVTKVIVSFICGVGNNMAYCDALALAFIMSTKGFLELGTMMWISDFGGMTEECFALLALYVIFMATLVPFVVKLLYDPMRKYGGYQLRDIMHLKPNAHLKLVACVLRSGNISSITNLLEFFNPPRNVPIAAYVLHLVKLVGRCQPLFISHAMQKRQNSYHSYSDEVIWHFDRLQQCSNGGLSTQVFTAMARVDAMHEYLCTLALDKLVSLIVLPFHRKFGLEGFITFEDHEQRLLNTSVLARSPCSVAILVDRSHVNLRNVGESSNRATPCMTVTYVEEPLVSVGVIFIGGNDDREALAFARRMNRGMRVKLTVIRLAASSDSEEFMNSLDAKAIDRYLREAHFEDSSLNQQIMYIQITVKDAVETVSTLRSIVHDYDLLIVGRRFNSHSTQTAGLEESCEVEELGVIGDLLASQDLKCRTSVLVVQQQQHWI
ncbi:hypothetical protein Cgig2_029310 [Carnegiea gigantea]|uniref:Cation/H+ exchanger domain-containing protein n=1 Tax=Carnegiea gigantea TaxID=171969 RepID=A0A9Q1KUT1_9CARY|nr:hypothetical protein Cgig2_029310 [Carnegiea gigantea]